jgi:adenylate cyclase
LALGAIDRAFLINTSCATALYLGAQAHGMAGHAETATSFANRALRLSPFDPQAFEAHMALGEAALVEAYLFQAIPLALAGRKEEAQPFLRRGFELEPAFRIRM